MRGSKKKACCRYCQQDIPYLNHQAFIDHEATCQEQTQVTMTFTSNLGTMKEQLRKAYEGAPDGVIVLELERPQPPVTGRDQFG